MSRSRHNRRREVWKPCFKKYGNKRFRARIRMYLHRLWNRDPEAINVPILKEAQNPWDWD